MQKVCWPYFDPDFDNLGERIYGPPCRVYIDNDSIQDCTVVKAIGTSRRESDFIKASEANNNSLEPQLADHGEHTAIEMTGTDRPGLFSEIFAAFADLHCNVMEAHAWSHNARLACIAYVSDDNTHTPIDDPSRLASIEDHLSTVIRATSDPASNSTHVGHKENETDGFLAGQGKGCMNSNMERRLHQLMLSVRDFDEPFCEPSSLSLLSSKLEYCDHKERKTTIVSIGNCEERGYSIVTVKSKDRRRLMFDTICTLVDITRVLRENGLTVVRADVEFVESVKKEMRPIHLEVKNEDTKIDTVGSDEPTASASATPQRQPQPHRFSLGDILRSQMERLSLNFVPTK